MVDPDAGQHPLIVSVGPAELGTGFVVLHDHDSDRTCKLRRLPPSLRSPNARGEEREPGSAARRFRYALLGETPNCAGVWPFVWNSEFKARRSTRQTLKADALPTELLPPGFLSRPKPASKGATIAEPGAGSASQRHAIDTVPLSGGEGRACHSSDRTKGDLEGMTLCRLRYSPRHTGIPAYRLTGNVANATHVGAWVRAMSREK